MRSSATGRSPCSSIADTSGTAEWLAAALQDNHRAIIVGTPTFSAIDSDAVADSAGGRTSDR